MAIHIKQAFEHYRCTSLNGQRFTATRVSTRGLTCRAARTVLFDRELLERSTEDVLDRALLRAHHAKLSGAIPAAEYHKVAAKVESLRKLRFTDDYEGLQDKTTYEWMKYKVAAEVGGP